MFGISAMEVLILGTVCTMFVMAIAGVGAVIWYVSRKNPPSSGEP